MMEVILKLAMLIGLQIQVCRRPMAQRLLICCVVKSFVCARQVSGWKKPGLFTPPRFCGLLRSTVGLLLWVSVCMRRVSGLLCHPRLEERVNHVGRETQEQISQSEWQWRQT